MDNIPPERRSENMRRIRSTGTSPEVTVRKILWSLGYRGYRVGYPGLPGKPDVVFTKRRIAIFVHGCFWHSHACREGRRKPKSNLEYWLPKLEDNKRRDQRVKHKLRRAGWRVITVWECQVGSRDRLESFLREKLGC